MRDSPGGKFLPIISLLLALVAPGLLTGRSAAPTIAGHAAIGTTEPSISGLQARGFAADELTHSFYFTRGIYSGGSWSTDAPQADRWIASVIARLTLIDISRSENFVALDDPDLGRFPFLYILEVGGMRLRQSEVEGLRNYLLKGGFVMVDDFWGTYQWLNLEAEIRRVLPDHEIVEIPLTHPFFSTMYRIDEIVQVPVVNRGCSGGPTYEGDGIVPHVRGVFDDDGELMMVINWNTDLGDAWEHAEQACYPLAYSTYAYQVAANTFMYSLSH
jgi:hypothetical protein